MHCTKKLAIPVVCMSLLLGACSSSGGASPPGDGGDTGADSVIDPGDTLTGGTDNGNTGTAGATDFNLTEGDTAGATTAAETVGTTGDNTDIVGAAPIQEIQGEWTTGCLDLSNGFFRTQTLSVIGARMLFNFGSFSDQECTVPMSLGVVLNGSTVQQSATTVPTGNVREVSLGNAIEVDVHFDEATVDNKPIPEQDFFGRQNFIEAVDFTIVLVQNDILYLGDSGMGDFDGETPETRPIALDFTFQYMRAP